MDILIPDTSSLINIHEIYVGRVHITNILDQLFNVQVSREIPHEIRRRKSKLGNYGKPMLQFVRQARRYFPYEQDYEHLIFNQFSPTDDPDRNRGERYNCALALYLVRKRYTAQVIMLTDDMKAHRGLIKWYENRFKTTKVWTSLELLLHIYLVMFPKWPYAQAESALQKVNTHLAGTRVEMTKRLREYRRYLMQLHIMLKALPSVKKRGEL
ncbi:MAG: hypothetical protein OXI24_00055 [Candidatus Poribacteria bacterium]|nr:hypothetical protein [Candidatus Poribacteria bacterium]